MSLRPRGRVVVAILALILIAFLVPPWINVSRYRARIATSISSAVGRRTTVDSITLRLLPRPGFELGGVTIADDPAFGAEPMLRADQVTANLRLSSLWRGRLEVAKLSLQYPSLNLVRSADRRWNFETLLERAARIPTAPTTAVRSESRPRFPYIEAEGARINLKLGQEKIVYSLADADFALWLEAENQARTRLVARMIRTDSYLSDTGTVTLEGRFQRAWNLRDTPMSLNVSIDNAQLGQLTKLLDGLDRGWRGTVNADISLSGTPSSLKVSTRTDIIDFRRYDITTLDRVRLEARCTAMFSSPTAQLSNIECRVPLSGGMFSIAGSETGGLDRTSYDLALSLDKVPIQQFISVARHAKKDIPDDLSAAGEITGQFAFRKTAPGAPLSWTGSAKTTDVLLRSSALDQQLALRPIEFAIEGPQPTKANNHARPVLPPPALSSSDFRLRFAPLSVPLGATSPATLSGWFNLIGYSVSVAGDASIPRLLRIARAAGLRTPELNAEGSARVDLAIAGEWSGFHTPKPVGTALLRNLKVRMKGVAAPLQISAANLALATDAVTASGIAAGFADSQLEFTGSVRMPRQCESIETCPIHFDLHASEVSTDELNTLFNPRAAKRPWYAILGRSEPSVLGSLNATGTIDISHLVAKSLSANRVVAKATLASGKLSLTELHADLWGGAHSGQFSADFTGAVPVYSSSGTLSAIALPQLAGVMKDNWATGTATATYALSARGFSPSDLLASASGEANFDWRKGALRHVSLGGASAPLAFNRFSGTVLLRDGKLSLAPQSKLATQSATYLVTGTASFGRQLDLTFRNGKNSYAITGTIEKPKVTIATTPENQASLKE